MADSRIKGITIELDGQTTGLQKALSDVTKQSIDIQKELKDVERLLKFDPSNVEAMAQKQKLLAAQIEATSNKLDRLKAAEQQVQEQFNKGEIAEAQYRAFRREIEFTESSLSKFKQILAKVDDSASLKEIKQDLSKIPEESEKAEESIKDLGGELTDLLAGAAAAGGIGEMIEKSLDASSLNTKLSISMELDEGSQETVKQAISKIQSYGVDAEAALEGVRRQWALNKDASDESNAAVVEGAAAIVAAYGDVDFTELIQETNELSKSLDISNEDAMGLVYTLLKTGFPPDQLDVITEYGAQLHNAGYNAQEIQAIMAAGVETGTWNIDVLLDGLKEGRIKLAEFGAGIDEATVSLIEGTGISANQLQEWGKAVAAGGEGGKQAMSDVAAAVAGIDDKTKQNAVGVKVFGTLWEENGTKITDTILGMNDNLMTAEANQNNLNAAANDLNADPAIAMKQAIADIQTAAAPLLVVIADIVADISKWIQENPNLSAAIIGIVSAIGILVGICMGLAPIFSAISAVAGVLGISMGAIAAPVLIAIAAIAALVAIGVLVYKNWDEIKAKAIEIWEFLKVWLAESWASIKESAAAIFNNLKDTLAQVWESTKNYAFEIWTSIGNFFIETIPMWIDMIGEWFLKLPNKIAYALGFALGSIIKWGLDTWTYVETNVPIWIESIGNFFATLPEKIWTWLLEVIKKLGDWGGKIINWIATTVPQWINSIVNFFSTMPERIWSWLIACVDNIRTWGVNMLTEAVSGAEKVFNGIVDTFKKLPQKMLDIGKNIVDGLKEGIQDAWDGMLGWMGGLIDDFVDGIKDSLDIHSPSRVLKQIGIYTGQGFEIGIASTIASIAKQAKAMAAAAIPDINTSNAVFAVSGRSQAAAGINQTVNIYSPAALSPAETAKQNKRVLQELALGL